MVKRDIITDIRKVKTTFIGGFTKRQIFCFVPAMIIVVLFAVFLPLESVYLKIIIGAIVSSPLILMGTFTIYGKPFEKGILEAINTFILSPPKKLLSSSFKRLDDAPAKKQKQIIKNSKKYKNKSEDLDFMR